MKTRSKSIGVSKYIYNADGSMAIVKIVWLAVWAILAVLSLAGVICGAMHNLITLFISIFIFVGILFTKD